MAIKPLRDWIYLAIIATQLVGMLALDLVPFYPKSLYIPPSSPLHFLLSLRSLYASTSGDPFFSDAIPEAPWFRAFLGLEGLVQLPLAAFLVLRLSSTKPSTGSAEIAGLAFGCLTAMGSLACCFELNAMGPGVLEEEVKANLLYGTYGPFLVIPAVMAADMYVRLLIRVQAEPPKSKNQ